MLIRLLTLDDLNALVDHCARHMDESGRDGDPIFTPSKRPKKELPARIGSAMARNIGEPGWMRVWAGFNTDGQIVGHADLRGREQNAEHRVLLGMGILRPYRRQRLGWTLLETVTTWARERGYVWLDLSVLSTNAPAQALYKRFGFVEVARFEDYYRVADQGGEEQSVDDIAMTLRL